MQRLPDVNPTDPMYLTNGTYMGVFAVGAADENSKILFYNESPLNLDLDFYNGATDKLHAWEAKYWTLDGDTKQIGWQISANTLNVTTPPINVVTLTLYGPNESVSGQYPIQLQRQVNNGNIGGITTSTTSIVNDANPAGTVFVEGRISGAPSSDYSLTVDGIETLLKILFRGSANVPSITTDGAGNLQCYYNSTLIFTVTANGILFNTGSLGFSADGDTLTTSGTNTRVKASGAVINTIGGTDIDSSSSLGYLHSAGKIGKSSQGDIIDASGATTYFKAGTGFSWQIPNGSTIASATATTLNWPGFNLSTSGQTYSMYTNGMSRISQFSGTGNGTVNHGLGATPSFAIAGCTLNGSTQTMCCTTGSSTQCTITTGSGLAWSAMALRF
jgi:hypothetical protein